MEYNNDNKFKIIITVSVIIILVLAIVIGVMYTINESKSDNTLNQTIEINETEKKELEETKIAQKVVENTIIENEGDEELNKRYGKIDIVWVDKDNNIISEPLAPVLKGMTPVKYSMKDRDFVNTTENDKEWYNYEEKKWANAVDKESYFVWIPRYAYKITYYSDNTYTTPIGYSDYRGILKINKDDSLTRINTNNQGLIEVGNHYILSPAFSRDIASGYRNGGWDSNISGIWVAKYEMSMETNGIHTETENNQIGNVLINDNIKAVSKPGVSSWRNISIGNSYVNAFNYNRELESHLMKNSEWGAVAYLAYSKYGINSTQLEINKDTNYTTGGSETITQVYIYNVNESTTGNNTGIYDLSGGAWEFTAGYINNGYSGINTYGGKEEGYLCENARNTKYKMVYSHGDNDDGMKYDRKYAIENYLLNKSKRGEAIFETSTAGFGTDSWGTSSSFFIQQDTPFFARGGDFANNAGAGLFSYTGSNGQQDAGTGYRVVIVCG